MDCSLTVVTRAADADEAASAREEAYRMSNHESPKRVRMSCAGK
jgi:hypothetical protein